MPTVRVECCESTQIAAQRQKVLARSGLKNFATIPNGEVTTAKVGVSLKATNEDIIMDNCSCILLAW
jgi:hypothetical protein